MKHLRIYQNGGDSIDAIIAERGEVYKDVTGGINKISNNAPSHDSKTLVYGKNTQSTTKGRGGIVLDDAFKVLSASQEQINSGARKDTERDDIVAINKDEAEEFAAQFGLKLNYVKAQISPAKLYEDLKKSKDKLVLKIGKKGDNINFSDIHAQRSYEANMAQANALPTDDELFENVFSLQESKKDNSGVDFESDMRQQGGIGAEDAFATNWFQTRAGFNISGLPRNVSEATSTTDPNLRSRRPNSVIQGYYDDKTKKIVLNQAAQDKESTFLHEITHEAQYAGLPNFDYQRVVPRTTMAQQIGNDPYLLDPKELHSRLMQYRRDNNLSPTDRIDDSFMLEGDLAQGPLLEDLNTAKRKFFEKSGKYQDYGVQPSNDATLKSTFKDPVLIEQLRQKGIRGDVPYGQLSTEQKRVMDNIMFEYEDKAAFELFQTNPEFEPQFFQSKGKKLLLDPRGYNLPTDKKTLNTILNDLTANEDTGEMDMARTGIYIKPENRGKFTSFANSRGMGVQEAAAHVLANKEDFSPERVKQANFARNAAKWNEYGGEVYQQGGGIMDVVDEVLSYPQKKMMSALGYPDMKPSEALELRARTNEHGWERDFKRNYPKTFNALGVAEDILVDPLSLIPASKIRYLKEAIGLSRLKQAGNAIRMADKASDAEQVFQEALPLPNLNVKKFGGSSEASDFDPESVMGFRDDSPYRFRDTNQINSNVIDMSNTGTPLIGVSNTGDTKILEPYSGLTEFNGENVTEIALRQQGGKSVPKLSGKAMSARDRQIAANNAMVLAKIQRGTDWLKNNPNASQEDRARITNEISMLKGDIIALEDGSDTGSGIRVKKPIPKEVWQKGVKASNDPSNLGIIETDPIIKTGPTTQASGIINPILPDVTEVKSKTAIKPYDVKLKLPDITYTAGANPVKGTTGEGDVEAPLSSFSDKRVDQSSPEAEMNTGLQWYDVAGDIMNLIDAQQRISPVLQQVDLPRVKLARPSADPAVNAIRQNYLNSLDALNATDDTTGAANINQVMVNANNQMMQAIAQSQQANIQVQNQEELANQQIAADETIRNLALKEDFITKVLKTTDNQRKQTLGSFQNIFDKIAKSERFNRTENTFKSVFAKNFGLTEDGRVRFHANEDDMPTFLAPTGQTLRQYVSAAPAKKK